MDGGTYHVVDVQVEVAPETAKGKSWDIGDGPAPDLVITVRHDGDQVARCRAMPNQYAATCPIGKDLRLDESTTLVIEVADEDTLVNDPVGAATLPRPSAWGETMAVACETTGQVQRVTVNLTERAAFVRRYQWQAVGLGIGVLGALGTLAMGRARLMPPRLAPPTCSHCRARLEHRRVTKCPNCGAPQTPEGL